MTSRASMPLAKNYEGEFDSYSDCNDADDEASSDARTDVDIFTAAEILLSLSGTDDVLSN